MKEHIRVVHIISPYKIVLNVGENDGITMSDKFIVYGEGPVIKDSGDGAELGVLEISRGRGKVVYLQEKMCTIECIDVENSPRTIVRKHKNIFSLGPQEESETIRNEPLSFEEPQIGDKAKFI